MLVDATAIREAIINAIVHNDYSKGIPPLFEIFSDRFTITSYGGLPQEITKEDFFSGVSAPRNQELMRVFKDVQLVEQLGSGMERIMSVYDKSIFEFLPNFLRVNFYFDKDVLEYLNLNNENEYGTVNGTVNDTVNDTANIESKEQMLIEKIKENPYANYEELAHNTDLSRRTIARKINELKNKGIIERIGSDKDGYWKINN